MKIKIKFILYAVAVSVAILVALHLFIISHANDTKYLSAGETAPNYTFNLANGSVASVSDYRGEPLLLWFVATWCDTCAEGNSAVADNLAFFEQHNVRIVELEQYDDLGEPGMSISKFISEYGDNNTYVRGGTAGYNMTLAYNTPPSLQLDIYYLISPSGKILYVGEGLAGGIYTMENMIKEKGL